MCYSVWKFKECSSIYPESQRSFIYTSIVLPYNTRPVYCCAGSVGSVDWLSRSPVPGRLEGQSNATNMLELQAFSMRWNTDACTVVEDTHRHTHLLEESLRLLKKGVSLRAGLVVGLPPEIVGHTQVVLSIFPSLLVRVVLNQKKGTHVRSFVQSRWCSSSLPRVPDSNCEDFFCQTWVQR